VTEELLKEKLMEKLKQVNTTTQQTKELKEKSKRVEDENSMSLGGWLNKGVTTVQSMAGQIQTECPLASKGCVGIAATEPTVVFVSCTSLASTQDARTKIKDLIIKSGYSFAA
jgi:hypothetical protein